MTVPVGEFSAAFSGAFDASGVPGGPVTSAGCSWPVSHVSCGVCEALADPGVRGTFEGVAVEYLSAWTGGVFGVCPVVVRPCRDDCGGAGGATFWGVRGGPWAAWRPVLVGGQWVNVGCGCDVRVGCSCGDTPVMLRLPGPIESVESVVVDGSPLPSSAYRVDNRRVLVRTDGGWWPTCQDFASGVDQPGTWQVSYSRGTPVPVGGQVAAGVLACELAKAACGDASCGLPQRVQSITRQGVTIAVLDSFEDVTRGRTGIWLIDSWVASVTGPPRGGSVRSVDVPRDRNRTTTWPR